MLGCCRRASIAPSRAMRSLNPWSTHSDRGSLSAAVRRMTPSARSASHTDPMPPSASSRSRRHGPTWCPGWSGWRAASASDATRAMAIGRLESCALALAEACPINSNSTARTFADSSVSRSSQAARSLSSRSRPCSSRRLSRIQSSTESAGRALFMDASPPTVKTQSAPRSRHAQDFSSTESSSLARARSRLTVRVVTPSASAISPSVIPPK